MDTITPRSLDELIATSKEVMNILGISQARLSQLVKAKKLIPYKRNIFLMDDVKERKRVQAELRAKFYRTKGGNK